MKKWMIPMLAVVLATTACSSDEEAATPLSGEGKVAFACQTEGFVADVTARATEGYRLPEELIPTSDSFELTLSGSYTEQDKKTLQQEVKSYGPRVWATVADYNTEAPQLEAGIYSTAEHRFLNSYSASFAYGSIGEEGAAKPCFRGEVADFTIAANKTTTVPVRIKLANSCFQLGVTEWMLAYYTAIELTIHTATSSFTFHPTSTAMSELIFVKPGQQLALSGKAVKAQNGVEVNFTQTTIGSGAVAAESCYTISVDHTTAGSGALQISFDDTFTDVPAVDVELNGEGN